MAKLQLKAKELRKIGFPETPAISVAIQVMEKHYKHTPLQEVLDLLSKILAQPSDYQEDEILAKIANSLIEKKKDAEKQEITLNETAVPFKMYGKEHIAEGAIKQMEHAIRLPISVAAALMPDAHVGYGLPIGGVLATENAVIPYGVGVDIGCRMSLSIYAISETHLQRKTKEFERILWDNTLFGMGGEFRRMQNHEVLENPLFEEMPFLKKLQKKAAKQLGSSGSGNHFVEFGIVEIPEGENEWNLPKGKYIGLLSHSGSRGLGANIAQHYTQIAKEKRLLPSEVHNLAWLDLKEQEGMEYWLGMNLAGDYASACHHQIHDKISKALGETPIACIENHHNFAWKETWNGKEVIVHRKGATPAGKGVLGIIPGSMTAMGFIVRGKGEIASLQSASHGAGRQMSRSETLNTVTKHSLKSLLEKHGVILLGGGLDEAPNAYKDIHAVMKSQQNLVDVVGTFLPKIVRMDEGK